MTVLPRNMLMVTISQSMLLFEICSWNDSVVDHAKFFTSTEWRKNNYRKVVNETDYRIAAQELKNAGYATDPSYAGKLISLIEAYKLMNGMTVSNTTNSVLEMKE